MEKIKGKKKIIVLIMFIAIIILIDQISKLVVSTHEISILNDLIKINVTNSKEAILGIGQNDMATFIITNIIVIGIIFKFMNTQDKQIDKKTYVALSLIISGGVGNLIDRIIRGYIIKIISIGVVSLSISDISIIIGWVMLTLFISIHTIKLKNKKEDKIE